MEILVGLLAACVIGLLFANKKTQATLDLFNSNFGEVNKNSVWFNERLQEFKAELEKLELDGKKTATNPDVGFTYKEESEDKN